MYVCMYLCECVHVCIYDAFDCLHTEINTRVSSSVVPSLFFETLVLIHLAKLTDQQAPYVYLSLLPKPWGDRLLYCSWFLQGSGYLSMGPHACLLGILPTGLSPQFPKSHGCPCLLSSLYTLTILFLAAWLFFRSSDFEFSVVFFMLALHKIS